MVFADIARQGNPSLAAGIVGVVLAASFMIVHALFYIKHRAWFLYLFVLSTVLETIGFSTRLGWIANQGHNGPLYASYLLMVVNPSLLVTACHMVFGRIIDFSTSAAHRNSKTFGVPARLIIPVVIGLDVLSLCFQLVGSSLTCAAFITSSDPDPSDMMNLRVGLQISKWTSVVQTIYLGVFGLLTIRFLWLGSCRRPDSQDVDFYIGALAWVGSTSSTLIMLQMINSVIEINSSLNNVQNYSSTHEWVFWVVDVLPIFLIFLSFVIVHPGRCLPFDYTRFRLKDPAAFEKLQDDVVESEYESTSSFDEVYDWPLPPQAVGIRSNNSSRSQRFQVLGELGNDRMTPDLWIFGTDETRGYNEISPYESDNSYRAYMHGAL